MAARRAPLPTLLAAAVSAAALLSCACARRPVAAPNPAAPNPVATATKAAATYQVVDLLPAFWEVWSEAEGRPAGEQARLLQERLAARHPEVYRAGVIGLDPAKPLEEELRARCGLWLPMMAPHMGTMRRLSGSLAADLPRFERSFRAAFPDLDYRGEVYFLNSLGGFDGAIRTVKGQMALLFGVDMIAFVYGPEADPQPFFHHELFHIHHAQVQGEPEDRRLYQRLWHEGLAEHVAKTLNPAASDLMIFGLPPEMPAQARKARRRLARELGEQLDSTSPEVYAKYFLGRTAQDGLPPRAGYYAGYLVAERLGRGRTLRDLARLRGPELRTLVAQALRDLEAAD